MEDWRKNEQRYGAESYSQHGEDLMLLNIFELLEIDKPSYLDLGAHHPVTISNTKLLYDRGCRGVNIEANPNLIKSFNRCRPDDKNVCVGVGTSPGTFPFYMYDNESGLNSFSREELESNGFKVNETIQVPVMTIDQIVNQFCGGQYPSLLLTDIEGLDFEVLESASFALSRPKIICSEVRRESYDFISMMAYQGYIPLCRMYANMIFVLRSLQKNLIR